MEKGRLTGIAARVLAAFGLVLLLLAAGSGLGTSAVIEIDYHIDLHIRSEILPTIDAGPSDGPHESGPFFTQEGLSIEFIASIGDDAAAEGPYTFKWDFSYDGTTFISEADGEGPFVRSYSDGPAQVVIGLLITMGSGEQVLILETVSVHNAPAVVAAGPDLTVQTGDQISLTASFTDPGTGDTHTAIIDWGDGTVTPTTVTEAGGSGTTAGTHTYNSVSIFTVTVTVTDNNGDPGKDSLKIRTGNTSPVAQNDSATVAEGGSVAVNVLANDSDPEEDPLTITAVTQGSNGTVTISGDSVTYSHGGSQTTADSFSYTIGDDNGGSATATVSHYGSQTTADTFSYTISDGNGGSDTATVSITVTSANDAPIATGDAGTVLEGGSVTINVLANDADPDGDSLTITAVTQGTNGTVAISGDSVTYAHDGSETTGDSFTYTISDGNGGSDTATVAITVTPVNDPPVATGDTATVAEGATVVVNVLANDSDPEQDTLTITAVTQGTDGAVAISGDSVTYTQDGSETISDSFTYTITDGNGGSDTATVTITITPVNDPPVATGDAATVLEGGSVVLLEMCTAEGD